MELLDLPISQSKQYRRSHWPNKETEQLRSLRPNLGFHASIPLSCVLPTLFRTHRISIFLRTCLFVGPIYFVSFSRTFCITR